MPAAYAENNLTCAMTMRSAQPSSMPVASKVPSRTDTRGSLTDLENTLRMPSLGSTARSSLIDVAQSGCASNARVKMPVPARSLKQDALVSYRGAG